MQPPSMAPAPARRYLFNGHAVPLVGRIRRPNDFPIPAQAPSTAAITGGQARARVDAPTLPGGIVTLERAESSVDADYEDAAEAVKFTHGNHFDNNLPVRTTTWAAVYGLGVVIKGPESSHELKVDRVEAELVNRSKRNGDGHSISPTKAIIEGVTVDGYGLEVILRAKMFCDCDTRDKLSQAYERDEDNVFSKCGHMFLDRTGKAPKTRGRVPDTGGDIHCTLVEKLKWTGPEHPDAKIEGHTLYIPEFGYVYFAEIFVGHLHRRLTMMRIHFGSPDGGELSVADSDNNGQAWPP